jgi:5'-AMP-activated protein kinase catalytic alpha subunit
MTCGYLPFEDPNTSKLYKKILNCDFLIPGFISKPSKDLIKKILNTDPKTRVTISDIRNHEWYQQVKSTEMEGIVIGKDRVPVLEEFLSKIQDCFVTSGISPNCNLDQTVTYIQNNKHN